ncbi:MAG: T9SS type A sorting domain-containing protein [Bacteroidota bacterium]
MKFNYLHIVFVALFFIACQQVVGQGWRRSYDFVTDDFAQSVLELANGDYLVGGRKLVRLDADGHVIWERLNEADGKDDSFQEVLHETAEGNLISIGNVDTTGTDLAFLASYAPNGDLNWKKEFDFGGVPLVDFRSSSFGVFPNGDYMMTVNYEVASLSVLEFHCLRLDSGGEIIWDIKYEQSGNYAINDGIVHSNGSIFLAGVTNSAVSPDDDAVLIRLDGNGNEIWTKTWDLFEDQRLSTLAETIDGEVIVAGYSNVEFSTAYPFAAKVELDGSEEFFKAYNQFQFIEFTDVAVDAVGNYIFGATDFTTPVSPIIFKMYPFGVEMWTKRYDASDKREVFTDLSLTSDGGFIILGYEFDSFDPRDLFLLKVNGSGNLFSHHLIGTVFFDENNNCDFDNEMPLEGWVVEAVAENWTAYDVTDADGIYDILIDTGEWELKVTPLNDYWEICEPFYAGNAVNFYDTTFTDIPVQALEDCPLMEVDINVNFLRLCNSNNYIISYCNRGTEAADDVTIEVNLPDSLTFISATAPILSQVGQQLIFDIGTVGPNECSEFLLEFMVGCDISLFGQTLCTEAHILPDTICGTPWFGPIIGVEATCENDSIFFEIINSGEGMTSPFEYIVIEDNIILLQGDFELGPGESTTIVFQAGSGATYHIIAEQDPDFPGVLGSPVATGSVEGCFGPINFGVFGQIEENDNQPWFSTNCQEVIASYDPNDKVASPSGWRPYNHFIQEHTELDYLIRFQNTGTDTAFRVVIIDTLTQFLDPASIRNISASHPFTYELNGQGILKFIFDPILLPDSTTNEPESNGFVKFHIAQQENNPLGTLIENTAYIYFDFNPPVQTNTTFHTIEDFWLLIGEVPTHESGRPDLDVDVFPNPCFESATIRINDYHSPMLIFQLFDQQGKIVDQKIMINGQTKVERKEWPAGIYYFNIMDHGEIIHAEKLVVR